MTPASIIPVFGSQRPYADLNFAGGSFGVGGQIVSDITRLPGFTFTRASLAMGYDATGKLTYGPNNLCLQSQTFDNASWVKAQGGAGSVPVVTANTATAPDGTLTADTVVFTLNGGTASGDISQLQQAITSPGPSLFSFWAMTTDGTSKVFSIVGNGGTLVTITVTGAWQRFVAPEPLVGVSTARLRLRGSASGEGTATSASIYLWGAQLEAVTYQTTPSTYYPTTTAAYYGPRLVYDPVTLASQGILVEEARTNICLQSQDFATTWATSRSSVTVNTTTSPDGTSNADKLVEDNTAGGHQLTQAITTAAVATTISVYAKPAGRDWIALGLNDSGASARLVYFDVSTGAVGTVGTGFTASIQAVGNGWYRCIATLSAAFAGANTLRVYATTADGVTSYTGDGTSGLFIWQAQLEAGTGASSPIPTTTASVTRAADAVSLTGLSLAYPLSIATRAIRNIGSTTTRHVSLHVDGNNFVAQGLNSASARSLRVVAAGVTTAAIDGAAAAFGDVVTLAGRYQVDNVALASAGAIVGTDVSAALPAATTTAQIGSFAGSSEFVNGTISRIRIYNRALSDAELQALTT